MRVLSFQKVEYINLCLNPYSTGRYSVSSQSVGANGLTPNCLNPYSTGRYSVRP